MIIWSSSSLYLPRISLLVYVLQRDWTFKQVAGGYNIALEQILYSGDWRISLLVYDLQRDWTFKQVAGGYNNALEQILYSGDWRISMWWRCLSKQSYSVCLFSWPIWNWFECLFPMTCVSKVIYFFKLFYCTRQWITVLDL